EMYKTVNEMLGDIVKVTPSSKVVGDFAIFMVQNNLTPENIYRKAENMAFPDSVESYFMGMMGQPMGGFPEKLQKLILKGKKPITERPGELLPDEDFDGIAKHLRDKFEFEPTKKDILSYALYPEVFEAFLKIVAEYGDLSRLGSDVFFHGLYEGEIIEAEVAEGRSLMIKLRSIKKPDLEGYRILVFEVNRNRREIKIKDRNWSNINLLSQSGEYMTEMADPDNKNEIGSPIPGTVVTLMVKEGDQITEDQPLVVVEAMKMETRITSSIAGIVSPLIQI
ncbi:MAG TPA: pyruvate carboxylase, partial [Desulfosporosinus sp.]|nr:pyruvate carboxylase [Desulfosporosinus sp.]